MSGPPALSFRLYCRSEEINLQDESQGGRINLDLKTGQPGVTSPPQRGVLGSQRMVESRPVPRLVRALPHAVLQSDRSAAARVEEPRGGANDGARLRPNGARHVCRGMLDHLRLAPYCMLGIILWLDANRKQAPL
jgi:hypothetical protein